MIRMFLLLFFAVLAGCVGDETAPSDPPPSGDATSGPLAPDSLEPLQQAFEATDDARERLAADQLEGLAPAARSAKSALEAAQAATDDAGVRALTERGTHAAEHLAAATDLAEARAAYGELSRTLFALAAVDPRLQEGWRAFRCPMADGFPRWFQRESTRANPYMGTEMPTCGTEATWADVAIEDAETAPEAGFAETDDVAYWTCAMHPSVQNASEGTCPICNMDLTPVTQESLSSGTILVDALRRQEIGVTTATVERAPLARSIEAVAVVRYDETSLTDVTLRTEGWIETLHVDEPGQAVRRGQPLFDLWSPGLEATQQELLQLQRANAEGSDLGLERLLAATRRRLSNWGLTEGQIDALEASGEVRSTVPILSPATGYVVAKHVVAGDHVQPGHEAYRIADLDSVWVEAELFEGDLSAVSTGQQAHVEVPGLPGRTYQGTVSQVYPYLQQDTRTGRVRVTLDNPDLDLKPGMYARVTLEGDAEPRLQVPQEAVVYTGPRRLVFVDLGEGRLQPREVQLGISGADTYEVLDGLEEGDVVVTSGNFLIAAESRLKSATGYWGGTVEGD